MGEINGPGFPESLMLSSAALQAAPRDVTLEGPFGWGVGAGVGSLACASLSAPSSGELFGETLFDVGINPLGRAGGVLLTFSPSGVNFSSAKG